MLDDPAAQKYNLLVPGVPGSSGKETAITFKLAAQLRPPVSFRRYSLLFPLCLIRAGTNTISRKQPHPIRQRHIIDRNVFAKTCQPLSLANNQLKTMVDIRLLTHEKNKLVFLRELVLTDNPIKGNDPANSEQHRRLVSLIPTAELHSPHCNDR